MQTFDLTQQKIFRLMKAEWFISSDFIQLQTSTLEKLGFTQLEVNWFLNKLEWRYNIDIQVESIRLDITLAAFIQLVLSQSRKLDKVA